MRFSATWDRPPGTAHLGPPRAPTAKGRSPLAPGQAPTKAWLIDPTATATAAGVGPGADADAERWYKDASIYEVHVRAFRDSNGDGIGDFGGLISRLDYLQDLGVSALWILPFYPSPLRDDGYDIADYRQVHPAYGSLRDFRRLLVEAHRRGLRVITELVLAHTSEAHPWFQRARRAPPGSAERDYYLWSDTTDRFADARVILRDFESSNWTYDPVAKAYFWHRFYSHQPSLNYDSPLVRAEIVAVVDYWLALGVDGLRLDAVPYLYAREGTSCENLPETFAFLRSLRAHVDERFSGRMLLAEANQWPEEAVAYLGPDACHMAFHFPLMPRMFMAVRQEDRFPIVDILAETPPVPEACQWALFLRNHDELTLEMVTDEERDYMYRAYAQDPQARVNVGIRRRLAPLLNNDRGLIELMNGLLCSLPGTPIVYYGDEIGMGDNIYLGDRNAVRTPMQWSPNQNAGFSSANPQRLYLPVVTEPGYHAQAVNVQTEQENPSSLLWWMRRLLAIRAKHRAFARGSLEILLPENRKVLAFLRVTEDEQLLVVANLSRFAQAVELPLGRFQGAVPIELFGATEFPVIDERPYVLTLGPHGFYWFSLGARPTPPATHRPRLVVEGAWEQILAGRALMALENLLPDWLDRRRWLLEETRPVRAAELFEAVPVAMPGHGDRTAQLALVGVDGSSGTTAIYALPLAFAHGPAAEQLAVAHPEAIVCTLRVEPPAAERRHRADTPAPEAIEGVLYDALCDEEFDRALLMAIARRRHLRGHAGRLVGLPTPALRSLAAGLTGGVASGLDEARPTPPVPDEGCTVVTFPGHLELTLLRRVEPGLDPVVEVGRALGERGRFPHAPVLGGSLQYWPAGPGREPLPLAAVQQVVPSEGEAWRHVVDGLAHSLEEVLAATSAGRGLEVTPARGLLGWAEASAGHEETFLTALPEAAQLLVGPHLGWATLLGRRTAELHLALATIKDDPAFAPEPLTPADQESMSHEARSLARRVFRQLRSLPSRPAAVDDVLGRDGEIYERLQRLLAARVRVERIRCHGDLHLRQVLWTGKDFVVTGLGGPPSRSQAQRRRKRPALVDVAGMLRSLHDAARASAGQLHLAGAGDDRPRDLGPWLALWYKATGGIFLGAYLEMAAGSGLVPSRREELQALLDFLLLLRAVEQLGQEARTHPDELELPAQGVLELLEEPVGTA